MDSINEKPRTVESVGRSHLKPVFGALGVIFASALFLFFFTAAAMALPVHPPLSGETLSGFNHACGVATDSQGDVYVSSAEDSKIEIFDQEHDKLAEITDPNEPCGLGVDSKGDVYVSEKALGKVVKYPPNVYPFLGTLEYGPSTTVDESGKAKGIAVDPFDDSLYVAEGTVIATYDSAGSPGPSVGVGELKKATGVAAYTYAGDASHRTLYVAAADAEGNLLRTFSGKELTALKMRRTIEGVDQDRNPTTADQQFGFGSAGVYLAAEPGSGHLFLYDNAHSAVDEFDATGEFFTQVLNPDFADAQPTALAAFPERSEVQHLQVSATGGSFTLTFDGQTTTTLAVDGKKDKPTATEVKAALDSLSTVGAGNISVFGEYSGAGVSGTYSIAFTEVLSNRDVSQLEADSTGLTGGGQTATVTTEAQGSGPGRLYFSAGASAGAEVLAFGALAPPSRAPRPDLSLALQNARAVEVDSHGDRYVAADKFIYVYDPSGAELTKIEDNNPEGGASDLAVDSAGNVYALDGNLGKAGGGRVVYFTPAVFPPVAGTQYSELTVVATPSDLPTSTTLRGIGLNPVNDHLFVTQFEHTVEFDSAANESKVLNTDFAGAVGLGGRSEVAVDGTNGDVYILGAFNGAIFIFDSSGEEVLARITGAGSLKGPFGGGRPSSIAVDQSNGHVIVFSQERGVAEEYDASGSFVGQFGEFVGVAFPSRIAVDNSGGTNEGSVFVAYFHQVSGFAPLAYGEPPVAATGFATVVGGGSATLNGTVDPRGFDLSDCHFDYESEAEYLSDGESFASSASLPCAESLAGIGKGSAPVSVHAGLSGLDPEGRYRFRLVAENKYGPGEGEAGVFGVPVLTPKAALPIAYVEATVRADIDPSGLATKFRVEYGTTESYGESTAPVELKVGSGPTDVAVHLFGLGEGITYQYRFVVENEAKTIKGPDQVLTTRERAPSQSCPNAEFRIGQSANLPDCRAYELVTPADTRQLSPYASPVEFNSWDVTPRDPLAGQRLAYTVNGTLPGFDGSGRVDGYRAKRGAGLHPSAGWTSSLVGPSYAEIGGGSPVQQGIAADQEYSIWELESLEIVEGTLPNGVYLRTPVGFELLGQGSLSSDPKAKARFLAPSAAHAIFSSRVQLEEAASPEGTEAIYDRTPTGTEVVSVAPDGSSFGGGESASYLGSTEDGLSILFRVGGVLYARRGGETTEVAASPSAFAGISADGKRVFYVAGVSGDKPADLFACDVDIGSCAGPEAVHSATAIAPKSIFVNVSADGSHAYFSSQEALTGGEENEAGEAAEDGEDNLYVWDAGAEMTRFVAQLDPADLQVNGFGAFVDLSTWVEAIGPGVNGLTGRANSPTRSTSDGVTLVFQSHAQLTPYENQGSSEVYRYDAAAASEQMTCVSCDPSGAPADGEARLQSIEHGSPVYATTLIPSVTDDGERVFFESDDRLLPEDANQFRDVYEWTAKGSGGCQRSGGCLALISSGQGEHASFLYSMTPDGSDVFFSTLEKLVGPDLSGTSSIYDARREGGIPDPPVKAPCQGDACQGSGSIPPVLPSPPSAMLAEGGNVGGEGRPRCAKGKKAVRRGGKTRCVKPRPKKRHHKRRRANANQRPHR